MAKYYKSDLNYFSVNNEQMNDTIDLILLT